MNGICNELDKKWKRNSLTKFGKIWFQTHITYRIIRTRLART